MSNLTIFIIAFFATICVVVICDTIKDIEHEKNRSDFIGGLEDNLEKKENKQ